ncbi:MAG: stage II sporulation protein P [Oscillospiraceae bacterium]|jgi:stage II sporulation protein P|nr:stage II sporulation protein P [Oscillospiraceae bacterium]
MRRQTVRKLQRGAAALVVSGVVLWLVAVTASSPTAREAMTALGREGGFALALLESQLGRWEDPLPAQTALAISQSPLLLAGREQVLALRRQAETDDGPDQTEPLPEPETPEDPALPEEPPAPPADPTAPFADNGVPARTLVPSSEAGYTVAGNVYINNRSDRTFGADIFDGTFSAALSKDEGPQVLILHTHGSEAYTMPPGLEYEPTSECRTTDCTCNVVRVGDELAGVLEAAGLTVVHDTTLHDYPEYSGAYDRSLTAAKAYLEQYPSIQFILDVHRDAISDGNGGMYKVVSDVAGQNAAQLSFVVGTDGGGLEHPLWQENLKLAAAITQCLAEDYPTLMRPITVRNSRYNQHLTTGTLLVEVGAAGNSLDEALLSARLLGNALAEVILRPGDAA